MAITQSSPLLVAKHLEKRIFQPDKQTLDILTNINLELNATESIAILGISGSGKTTLLSILAGLDTPTAGSVTLDQHPLNKMTEDQRAQLRNRYIGFIFQSFQLIPALNALHNVMLPLEIGGDEEAETKAQEALYRVGLANRIHNFPSQLSGGEQQRVAIARAYVTHPKILFADEPTGNLDPKTGAHIIDLLFEMNQANDTALIIVTHDQALAKRCHRQLELREGSLHPL